MTPGWVLAAAKPAQPAFVVAEAGIQLRGTSAEAILPLPGNGMALRSGNSVPTLNLHLQVSELVDLKRSTLSVLVNGQAVASRNLARGPLQNWQVKLPNRVPLQALSVRARLVPLDEACTDLRDGLWLTLLPPSNISGLSNQRLAPSQTERVPVRQFPQVWSNLASVKDSGLPMQLQLAWDPSAALALLQVDHWLREQGLQASLETSPLTQPGPSMLLSTFDKLPAEHPVAKRLKQVPQAQFVIHAAAGLRLEVYGKDAAGLLGAMQLLRDPQSRELCRTDLCSSTVGAAPPQAAQVPVASDPQEIWRLGDGDRPRGWSARGAGSHTLRQVWVRPKELQLKGNARLLLVGRSSSANDMARERSTLTLTINDRPLATYSLAGWEKPQAQVLIPPSIAREEVWVIDWTARIVPSDRQACRRLEMDDLWFSVDPETRILADHVWRSGGGIAQFEREAKSDPDLLVTWSDPQGRAVAAASTMTLKAADLLALSPMLRPLLAKAASAGNKPMAWGNADACAKRRCVVLHASPAEDSSALLTRLPVPMQRLAEARKLPHLPTHGTAVMALEDKGDQPARWLHLVSAPATRSTLPEPSYPGLVGPMAVFAEGWRSLESEALAGAADGTPKAETGGNLSNEQRRLRWINLVWALLSIAVITVLAVKLWRKKKPYNPTTWESS